MKRVITFSKNANNSKTPHCCLPRVWLEDMGIDENNRNVIMNYSDIDKSIIIKGDNDMSLNKFNKNEKLFDIDTKGFEYFSLAEAGKGAELHVRGFFTNNKGRYGEQAVLITDDKLYNLPSHMVSTVKDIMADEDSVAAINAGTEYCYIDTYEDSKFHKKCYKIVFK